MCLKKVANELYDATCSESIRCDSSMNLVCNKNICDCKTGYYYEPRLSKCGKLVFSKKCKFSFCCILFVFKLLVIHITKLVLAVISVIQAEGLFAIFSDAYVLMAVYMIQH
jgi:hypothetical protein